MNDDKDQKSAVPIDWTREWPVVEPPYPGAITRLAEVVEANGGRVKTEPHADRAVTMEFPVEGQTGIRIKKSQDRCECRRRAVMAIPTRAGDPVRVCAICDAIYTWPDWAARA